MVKKIDYKIKPLDIILVNTSAGECYGKDNFLSKGCNSVWRQFLYIACKPKNNNQLKKKIKISP